MTTMPALAAQTATASLAAASARVKTGLAPSIRPNETDALTASPAQPALDAKAKARTQATDFEAVFLHSMFSEMFTGIDGEGPFGGSGGAGVWRSFLSDEYAKSFAKAGGIGLADHVYRALLAQQEARPN
jgi:Rod binding domain-containing protein